MDSPIRTSGPRSRAMGEQAFQSLRGAVERFAPSAA